VHGHASEVFDETSSDALLAGEPLPADLATAAEGARDAVVSGAPPADQTEPAAGPAPGTGTVTSPRGGQE
jgi:hypothetical protein